jgi:hypothetical protein
VNEPVCDPPAAIVPEQAVPLRENVAKGFKFLAHPLGRISIVVQMNLDVAVAPTAQVRQAIEIFCVVLLLGIEERVLGWPAATIGKAAD